MILPALLALAMVAETASPAPSAGETPPVIARIDALMAAWQGKPGQPLRGRLGMSYNSRLASDGEVVFWRTTLFQGTICGADPASGALRCDRGRTEICQLAVSFDTEKRIKAWRASGDPEACRQFVDKIGAP